jgi:hypothetical protein
MDNVWNLWGREPAMVVALASSQAVPVDARRIGVTMRAVTWVRQALAGPTAS